MFIIKRDNLVVSVFTAASLLLTACANQVASPKPLTAQRTVATSSASDTGAAPPPVTGSVTIPVSTLTQPLEYKVNGTGNHVRHICVPAQKKLILRIKPQINLTPLLVPQEYPVLVNTNNGTLLYDGGPALYTQFRVRMSIPATSASWDFLAKTEEYSVAGDYSSHLGAVAATDVTKTNYLSTPEYVVDRVIFGSNRYDGLCTYWENQLGRCSELSYDLRQSEMATCPSGQQKILISNIVSDYPCLRDNSNWCQGGSIQTVPDTQPWSIIIQAATENTRGF